MATAYKDVWSDYGSPYYQYYLDVFAPTTRTDTSVTFTFKFWARLEGWSYDGDRSMWFDIGGKEGADTSAWTGWYSCGNTVFRSGTWDTRNTGSPSWNGPWEGSVTVKNLSNTTNKVRVRLWVNRESGNAGKIDRRSYELSIPIRTSYTISYDANGGTGAPASQTKWHGENLTLSSTKPTRANEDKNGHVVSFNTNGGETVESLTAVDTYSYQFSSWNTASNGSGTSYNSGATFSTNSTTTLYAIWDSTKSTGSITLPTASRSGFTFLGWSENASSTDTMYNSGDSYTPSSDTTLYAIWRANLVDEYVLKSTQEGATWETLIANQNTPGSTLYEAGGQYNGWSIDSRNYVLCFGKRIKYNNSYVIKTSAPVRGGTYYYYE